jgi:hypothetical protein
MSLPLNNVETGTLLFIIRRAKSDIQEVNDYIRGDTIQFNNIVINGSVTATEFKDPSNNVISNAKGFRVFDTIPNTRIQNKKH